MGRLGKITSLNDLPKDKVLLSYIKEAVKLNEENVKLPTKPKSKQKKELVVPEDFTKAVRKNKKARETLGNFSYSKKKEYVDWIRKRKRMKQKTNE